MAVGGHLIQRVKAALGRLGTVTSRRGPLGIAVAVAIGIGSFYVAESIVAAFIAPLIAIFIGSPHFELNTFTINGVEFKYGIAIEYLLSFILILGFGYAVLSAGGDRDEADDPASLRRCPECTMSIPAEATRCPHCTTHLATGDAPSRG